MTKLQLWTCYKATNSNGDLIFGLLLSLDSNLKEGCICYGLGLRVLNLLSSWKVIVFK